MSGRGGVSVVMATFDGARFIEQQVRSVLAQTVLPAEILVGDDGSQDDTVAILTRVADDSPVPIRIHRNERRLGYGENFLRVAQRAQGRYIAFCDQDDVWRPTKIERSLEALGRPGVVLVAHQMNLIDQDGRFLRLDTHGAAETTRFRPGRADPFGVFFGFTMTFERSLLDLLPLEQRGVDSFKPPMALAHDRWAYFLGTTFGEAELLAEPLADYRQHATQSFGVLHATRLVRVRRKLAAGPAQAASLARVARARHALLVEHRGAAEGDVRLWDLAEARWARVARWSARRANAHLDPSLAVRAGSWMINVVTGAYRGHRAGGLGGRHLLEDLAAGVLGPFVRHERGRPSVGAP